MIFCLEKAVVFGPGAGLFMFGPVLSNPAQGKVIILCLIKQLLPNRAVTVKYISISILVLLVYYINILVIKYYS